MIASLDLQNAYLNLYKIMREYLWDVDTLEHLAEVEAETYTRFIDRDKLKSAVFKLERDLSPTFEDDEELSDAYDDFKELVDSDEQQYAELYNTELV